MFNIRAGIIKNLKLPLKDVYKEIIKELICRNGVKDIVEKYLIVDYMKEQNYFASNIECMHIDPEILFNKHKETIMKYLLEQYDLMQIMTAVGLYLDVGIILDNINMWKNVNNSIGIKKEHYVKDRLRDIGIIIYAIKSKSIAIQYNNIDIILNGRPDGIIKYTYGNLYKKNTVVEIKYKKYVTNNNDIYQLAAYALIFESDVLYIVITENGILTLKLYTYNELKAIWDKYCNVVFSNCYYLYNLFSSVYETEQSLQQIVKLIKK